MNWNCYQVVANSILTEKQGLSAACVGKEKDKVLLFGGSGFSATDAFKQSCSSDVSIFQEKNNEVTALDVAVGENPRYPLSIHPIEQHRLTSYK